MKKQIFILFVSFQWLCITPYVMAQQVEAARTWSLKEISDKFGANYEGMPIHKVYEYRDKGGLWNIVLCENRAVIARDDTTNTQLKAICLLNSHGRYVNKWSIQDAVLKKSNPEKVLYAEKHIRFWNQYSSFTDMDGDGYVDPLIVYSTTPKEGDQGIQRVKLIVLYKGRKYAIRAVECGLDYCRHLQYDAGFKTLPPALRKQVEAVMERMRKEQNIILSET